MSQIDLETIKEKLRVEGRKSLRMPIVVSKVRRVLWPFIRSYHFLTLEWVRDQIEAAEVGNDRLRDRQRALRAELLALSRENVELRAARDQQAALVATLQRAQAATDLKLGQMAPLQRARAAADLKLDEISATLAGEMAARRGEATGTEPGVVLALANAVCCRTPFGPMVLRKGDLISEEVARHGCWDAHLLPWIEAGAKHGSVAIDAGAHFGTLTCAMACHFQQVHSFEPNFANFAYLRANAALRPAGRIIARNIGLYSEATELSFAPPEQQELKLDAAQGLDNAFEEVRNTGALAFSPRGTGINTIGAITLDSLGLEDVGFIKVDCQGSDGPVILGARETIRRCRPIVAFEWEEYLSRNSSVPLDAVKKLFEETGYRLEIARQHNEKQIDYVALPSE